MKVWRYDDSSGTPGLVPAEVEPPTASPGELLVRVHAAGVTPTERLWYPTTHQPSGEPRRGTVPGHEFSGVVAGVGAEAGADFRVGQEVYGMNDWFADGATAEFVRTAPAAVAAKPGRLTHVEAASVPIGALTARQGLFDRAALRAGERVLVHGGAGAVGVFAVQLARWRGAEVIATASAANLEFVRGLGADRVIDYRAERFEDPARGVDVVFDTVGGETLERSWGVLGPGGRLVTIAASEERAADERTRRAFFIVEPSREQLAEIARLIDGGSVRSVVGAVFPFADANQAYQHKPDRGKTVLGVVASE
ncbi:MAG TPA: NADP-dependent oxidoreductase [Gemmataceae bacterium]|jgi:NADPH:quinone reductase-like Zn-dependent oxidoreductase